MTQDAAAGASEILNVSLIEALRSHRTPLLWDGGIGTALIVRGLLLATEPPEAWLWSHRDEVELVHRGFAEARVDVLQTNGFGLVRLAAAGRLPQDPSTGNVPSLREFVHRSVSLARAGQRAGGAWPKWLVASLGPTGASGLEPERLAALYGEAATAVAETGVAALHLETCFDPLELRVAVAAVRRAAPELPLLVSLTVTHGQLGLETPLGVPLARMLSELSDEPPALIGVNCSQNAERMRGAVAAVAHWANSGGRRLPVLARPQLHNGMPDCKRPAKAIEPQRFAEQLLTLLDEGATAIGGCCGVTAAHLAAVRQAIEGFFSPPSKL
jgi:5-methyltetrahydrofolate--homocysteine methyltransferase